MAAAISAMSRAPARAVALGAAGQAAVRDRFSEDVQMTALLAVYAAAQSPPRSVA